jgi:uncharacterized RDD family membrane protein YckC
MIHPNVTVSMPLYASRSQRFVAQVIDGCVAFMPILFAFLLTHIDETMGILGVIAAVGWAMFYLLFADGFTSGQSVGKRMLGMRVIDLNSGAPCTFLQSFIRNVVLSALGPIDWIFIFGATHQRLGDRAAGTIVVPAEATSNLVATT